VFLGDQERTAVLADVHRALRPGGHLVFKTRRPEGRAWEEWEAQQGEAAARTPSGLVTQTFTGTRVNLLFVSFRHRLRPGRWHPRRLMLDPALPRRDEIERSLAHAGFMVADVRDAQWTWVTTLVVTTPRPGTSTRAGSGLRPKGSFASRHDRAERAEPCVCQSASRAAPVDRSGTITLYHF